MVIKWQGNVYINEESINPNQYWEFFDRPHTSLTHINDVLQDGGRIPCTSLNKDTRFDIMAQMENEYECGVVYSYGEELHWVAEVRATADDRPVTWEEIGEEFRNDIAMAILEDYLTSGEITI